MTSSSKTQNKDQNIQSLRLCDNCHTGCLWGKQSKKNGNMKILKYPSHDKLIRAASQRPEIKQAAVINSRRWKVRVQKRYESDEQLLVCEYHWLTDWTHVCKVDGKQSKGIGAGRDARPPKAYGDGWVTKQPLTALKISIRTIRFWKQKSEEHSKQIYSAIKRLWCVDLTLKIIPFKEAVLFWFPDVVSVRYRQQIRYQLLISHLIR